jgi:hypothetical protein
VSAKKKKITIPWKRGKIELFPPEGETFKDTKYANIPSLEGPATYGGENYTYRIMKLKNPEENKASSQAIPSLRFTPMSVPIAAGFRTKSKPRQRRSQQTQKQSRTYIIVLKKL